MNFYYCFYCKAYNWYNTTGKKSKDTLRVSAIALISALPCFNFMALVFYISLLYKETLINKWVAVLVYLIFLGFNLLLISSERSDVLLSEYELATNESKKRINRVFYFYLLLTIILFAFVLGYTAYYKNKYGNYDL